MPPKCLSKRVINPPGVHVHVQQVFKSMKSSSYVMTQNVLQMLCRVITRASCILGKTLHYRYSELHMFCWIRYCYQWKLDVVDQENSVRHLLRTCSRYFWPFRLPYRITRSTWVYCTLGTVTMNAQNIAMLFLFVFNLRYDNHVNSSIFLLISYFW